ncbi:MAG: hypothetical protein HYU71_06515 [Bacteroidetes bacterium]|nr:hypothetical protein [Bacteroidota bacterium]
MKLYLLVISLLLLAPACRNGPEKRFQPYLNDLDAIFHTGSLKKWSNQSYKPEEVLDIHSPAYTRLTAAGILNANSKIVFSSPDCIWLINRKNHAQWYIEQKGFSDTVIMFNGNEGHFACGINDIYTMNQDESITSLHISVYQIDALLNVFIVHN